MAVGWFQGDSPAANREFKQSAGVCQELCVGFSLKNGQVQKGLGGGMRVRKPGK